MLVRLLVHLKMDDLVRMLVRRMVMNIDTTKMTKEEILREICEVEDRCGRAETIEDSLQDHYLLQELRKAYQEKK